MDCNLPLGEPLHKYLSLVVVGPPKCGKSTIVSHLVYDKEPDIENKVAQTAYGNWAWLLDESEEERKNGTSVLKGRPLLAFQIAFSVFDVPSHDRDLVSTASGIASADCVVLVVPATAGEFESAIAENGHVEELVMLCSYFQIRQVIVAVSKMDTTEPKYSEARFHEVGKSVWNILFKYSLNSNNIRFIPIAHKGDNITKESASIPWFGQRVHYNHKVLLNEIRYLEATNDIRSNFRMTVQDVKYVEREGYQISGRILQGMIKVNKSLVVGPGHANFRIKRMAWFNRMLFEARKGQHVSITVVENASQVKKGMIVSNEFDEPHEAYTNYSATIRIRPGISKTYRVGESFTILCHNALVSCRITEIIYLTNEINQGTNEEKYKVSSGQGCCLILELAEKATFVSYRLIPRMANFAIIENNKLIGGGVLDKE